MTYIKLFLIAVHVVISSILCSIAVVIDRSFRLFFKAVRFFSGGILFLSGVKLKVTGSENLEPGGIYVFVSNHSSQYDIPAMQYSAPSRVAIIYKKELEKVPVFGWALALSPYIKIDRNKPDEAFKSIERAKAIMYREKVSVILFAEGTRSRTGEIQPFKRGAFYLASRTGFPIVPVTVSGTSKIMPKGTFKIKSGVITVHYDKPVIPGENLNKKEELELMENVRNTIIRNYRE